MEEIMALLKLFYSVLKICILNAFRYTICIKYKSKNCLGGVHMATLHARFSLNILFKHMQKNFFQGMPHSAAF